MLELAQAWAYRSFGVILLISAALKAAGSGAAPLTPDRILPETSRAFVGVEVVVGLWVLSGLAPRAGRLVAVALTTTFLAVNVVAAARGAPSCGCFGPITVPPAVAAAVEAVYLAALVLLPARRPWTPADANALWAGGLAAVLFAGYVGVGYWRTGRVSADWVGRGGEKVEFEQDAGEGDPGAVVPLELAWTNAGPDRVQLTYLRASCGCMQAPGLPAWVAPGETVRLPVAFRSPATPGPFRRDFTVLTTTATLRGFVHGRVRAPAAPPSCPARPGGRAGVSGVRSVSDERRVG
jgi:hypothetical protein